jgi:hypothetical protein
MDSKEDIRVEKDLRIWTEEQWEKWIYSIATEMGPSIATPPLLENGNPKSEK